MLDSGQLPRSYVRHQGRLTAGQRRALEHCLPTFAAPPGPLDAITLFGEARPLVVEVGCGDGGVLLELARNHPELGFLGIEVYRPGVGHLAMALAAEGLHHVRLATEDARQVMARLAPASIDRLLTLFPDPWPKKRHHKRRLIEPDFVADVVSRLKPGGHWQLATDAADYAAAMRQVLGAHDALEATASLPRPMSKYQRRALRLGQAVSELAYRRVEPVSLPS